MKNRNTLNSYGEETKRRDVGRGARFLVVLSMACLVASVARAVPPAPGQRWRGGKTCYINSKAYADRALAVRGAPSFAPPTKNYSVIVLQVEFSDTEFVTSNAAQFFHDVQDYYKENSFGVFVPTFTISPVFTLPNAEASYGQNCGTDFGCKVPLLISHSISVAEPSIDFNNFDQIMIYHAGYGEEANGSSTEIWSLFFPSEGMAYYGFGPIRADGKHFDGAMVVPERERGANALGVICHEYGHQLGLPDLYAILPSGEQVSTLGAWDLMDYPWTGSPVGANPPHLGAWSKRFLGFGSTEVVTSTGTVSFSPIELAPGKSMEIFRSGSEYFLVEYRLASAATFDRSLPQSAGLAVWHVDDAVINDPDTFEDNIVNSPNIFGHKGVDLVEADGRAANPHAFDNGIGDGFTNGQTFSSPASNLFTGSPSSLVMNAIQGVGGPTATASLFFRAEKNTQSVVQAISYPNPSSGNPTFRIELARHPTSLSATLYTILGERVLTVPKDAFIDQGAEGWIFKYAWNGKDETGAEVASGVYYLQFNVDGEKVRRTLVVQR